MNLHYADPPALNLTPVLTSIRRDSIRRDSGRGAVGWSTYRDELFTAIECAYPGFTWHRTEPERDTILIDPQGCLWTYQQGPADFDPSIADQWVRHRYDLVGLGDSYTDLSGPDWDDVLDSDSVPLRTYVPAIDGPAIWKYCYWPQGVANYTGVGEPVLLTQPPTTVPEDASGVTSAIERAVLLLTAADMPSPQLT